MRIIAYTLALLCLLNVNPVTATSLADIRKLWEQGDYPSVIVELLSFRDSMFGKNVEVDYMLATSLCRNPGDEEIGQAFLQHILKNYPLSDVNRASIEQEKAGCSTTQAPAQLAFLAGRGTAGGGSGVRGKMFYWVGGTNRAIGGDPLESIREIPASEIKSRLFPKSASNQAGSAMQNRLGGQARVHAGEHFVFGSLSDHSSGELVAINGLLDKALDFISQQYSTTVPDQLLSAYLLPDAHLLREQGKNLHGLNVARGTIGYSFQNDLSLSAVVRGPHVGTLKHELTHLMVRTNFGDAPPWLDEGLASLYEVSRQEGDVLRGLPNWRGEVLKRLWHGEPSIAELLDMSWAEFDAERGAMEAQAVNHALARYWVLFLQDRGVLSDIYNAIRTRDVRAFGRVEYETKSIIESILGEPLAELELQFKPWLQTHNQQLSAQDVKSIQSRLNAMGYSAGPTDGMIGSKTLEAIKRFQVDHGYEPDGRLDATMIGLLKSKTGR